MRFILELPGLMGALVYSGSKESLAASPYKHLLDPIVWEQLADHFARDACALLGLSVQSPLSIMYGIFNYFSFLFKSDA